MTDLEITPDLHVEIAVIGAGTAGMRAYREASRITDSVLLIEAEQYGTTCARVGCMPSKLLIAAAEAAHGVQAAPQFGVMTDPPRIDGRAVMKRAREERDRFVGFVVETVQDWPESQRVMGRARFVTDNLLALDDGRHIRADRVVIATGSRPAVPGVFAAFGDRAIVNDDVFSWDDLPRSVAVFGAGVIGLELGQALHRLGVRTGLFSIGGQIGPISDPAVRDKADQIFSEGFDFFPDANISGHRRTDNGIAFEQVIDGETVTREYDLALIATGRRPNIDGLGLENTSLVLDGRGMPEFDRQTGRCGNSTIFIAGDANNAVPLLHEAATEGYIAGVNAANYPEVRRYALHPGLGVVFSDPQIMIVGEGHRALTERGADFETGALDWVDQGRARVMGVNRGLLHVYGEADTGLFLGAEMIGPAAEHLAHLLAWSLQSRLTVSEMLDRPFYHPVIEEGLRTALQNLNAALGFGRVRPPNCLDCGPGV